MPQAENKTRPGFETFGINNRKAATVELQKILAAQMSLGVGNDSVLYTSAMFLPEKSRMASYINELSNLFKEKDPKSDSFIANPEELKKSMSLGGFIYGLSERSGNHFGSDIENDGKNQPGTEGYKKFINFARGVLLGYEVVELTGGKLSEDCHRTRQLLKSKI